MNKFLGIILAIFFSAIIVFQAQQANALTLSPLTGPITNPITSSLVITGKVTYRTLGGLFDTFFRLLPAQGVTVKATRLFNNSNSTSTITDAQGNYVLPVPQNGLYKVSASDTHGTFFVPPVHVVNLHDLSQKADFQGLKF